MTVKKRLAVSNIIMIISPVIITLLVGCLCLGAVYIALHSSNGFGFDSGSDFYNTSRIVSDNLYEIFEHDSGDTKDRLKAIGNVIDRQTMFVKVYENGDSFYEEGNRDIADTSLMSSAKQIGSGAFVSDENTQLYYYTENKMDATYELYLFSNNAHTGNRIVKNVIIVSASLIVISIILSIIFTNRFLTKFVFRKIEEPLSMLSEGVSEISNGNLDYRLSYTQNDEFLPVCTAFNEMAERLKKSVELTQKNEENRKELLLDISHDLRSPLTSIQAYVEGLLDGIANTPEMQQKYLQTIKRKTTDIEKMVASLFAYSKLDMEELDLNIQKINTGTFFSDVVKSLHEEYIAKGLDISFSGSQFAVFADEEMLLRITSNLLENSLKYKGKPEGKSVISVSDKGNFTYIEFADDGTGVNPDNLDRLFEVFYRTDKARSNTENGSGIGLAFVKKAVEAMGGDVRAENNTMGGLSIIISLKSA